jgi:predicted enzyme related to lactoylglutathione lyase
MDKTKITGINMASVYSSDIKAAYEFYIDILGLDGGDDREAKSMFINIGKDGFYIESGYSKMEYKPKSARTTFTFKVESVGAMFKKLMDKGITTVHDQPQKMGENIYWLQCFDFEGNIVEFLGGE